jgi:hypothetical protein
VIEGILKIADAKITGKEVYPPKEITISGLIVFNNLIDLKIAVIIFGIPVRVFINQRRSSLPDSRL